MAWVSEPFFLEATPTIYKTVFSYFLFLAMRDAMILPAISC
ncbi:hypothetical protein C8N25_10464 [Algoriphagus antarcticus]|uniref:Uncharacterized protein n=1 Tax=Algoriphagus antarcticus TaxID=238540 RepID=A0A3E0E1C7_9BACT|nr:hypothetical protein C8N25_10464 [Algoriphagus antarcticus]